MPAAPDKIYVVATYNHEWFLAWCRKHHIRPTRGNVRYLSDVYEMLGADYDIVLLDGWQDSRKRGYSEMQLAILRAQNVWHEGLDVPQVDQDGLIAGWQERETAHG